MEACDDTTRGGSGGCSTRAAKRTQTKPSQIDKKPSPLLAIAFLIALDTIAGDETNPLRRRRALSGAWWRRGRERVSRCREYNLPAVERV
jgi:hypothetical protein